MNHSTRSRRPEPEIFIEQRTLFIVIFGLLIAGSAMMVPTMWIRWRHKQLKVWECAFLVNAFVFYLAYEISLLQVMPIVYRLNYISLGKLNSYPNVLKDARILIAMMFTTSLLSWTQLWSIKLSLLVFYRRLMVGLPVQLKLWRAILLYTILTYVFSIVSTAMSCGGPANIKDPWRMYLFLLEARLRALC